MNLRHLRLDSSNPTWINLWVDVENRSLNVMSSEVFQELDEVTRELCGANNTKPVVVRSAKARGNIVGADIKEILAVENDAQIQAFLKRGQDVYQAWEDVSFPTIAWIRGASLGGGLEWAMACQYRFACSDNDTVLGMPECKLGLLPGWGGTQRLPRWVGLAEGWRMLALGDSISSQKALEIGLVDGLWDANLEEDCLTSFVQRVLSHPGVRTSEPSPSVDRVQQWKDIASNPASIDSSSDSVPAMTLRSRETIAKAITVGLEQGFAAGCRCERELFYSLLSQPDVQQGLQRFAPRKPASSS
ncbi:MAG: enoyl-CoA hydratase/isomerase family protein [Planctomycetes bacterium]|nr:enoyl-CoA hydratase/isomerase family protein [Planctomycetota bacterium]